MSKTGDLGEVGGIARLSTLVQQTRRENPGRVLFLHAGDILSRGDPTTIYYGGHVNFRVYWPPQFSAGLHIVIMVLASICDESISRPNPGVCGTYM